MIESKILTRSAIEDLLCNWANQASTSWPIEVALQHDAALRELVRELLTSLEAIGTLPGGWCCCPRDRREDREHCGECADARAAILKARANG